MYECRTGSGTCASEATRPVSRRLTLVLLALKAWSFLRMVCRKRPSEKSREPSVSVESQSWGRREGAGARMREREEVREEEVEGLGVE